MKSLKVLSILVLMVFMVVACSKGKDDSAASQAMDMPQMLVSATKAIVLDIPWNKEYPAEVAGSLEVQVRAQVSGILKERLYNEGEYVQKDKVLFIIDPQEYQIALEKAEASLEQANTEVQRTKRDYERMAELIKDNAVSRKDYDDSLSDYEKAQANYRTEKSAVDDAKRNLGYSKVKAPIAGIARKENHSVGSLISTNGDDSSLLTTMVRINPLHINFSIPGRELAQLKDNIESEKMALNEKAVVDVLIGEKVYPHPGKIIFFDSAEDSQTSAFSIKVEVPNPGSNGDLYPGQFVKVRIKSITFKNAVLIPQSALIESPTGTVVYVVNTSSNNIVEVVPVSAEIKDSIAVVYSGLKGDETVVSGGSLKIREGMSVNVELKNIELPEDFKQAYIKKYGHEPQQEASQAQQEQIAGSNEKK